MTESDEAEKEEKRNKEEKRRSDKGRSRVASSAAERHRTAALQLRLCVLRPRQRYEDSERGRKRPKDEGGAKEKKRTRGSVHLIVCCGGEDAVVLQAEVAGVAPRRDIEERHCSRERMKESVGERGRGPGNRRTAAAGVSVLLLSLEFLARQLYSGINRYIRQRLSSFGDQLQGLSTPQQTFASTKQRSCFFPQPSPSTSLFPSFSRSPCSAVAPQQRGTPAMAIATPARLDLSHWQPLPTAALLIKGLDPAWLQRDESQVGGSNGAGAHRREECVRLTGERWRRREPGLPPTTITKDGSARFFLSQAPPRPPWHRLYLCTFDENGACVYRSRDRRSRIRGRKETSGVDGGCADNVMPLLVDASTSLLPLSPSILGSQGAPAASHLSKRDSAPRAKRVEAFVHSRRSLSRRPLPSLVQPFVRLTRTPAWPPFSSPASAHAQAEIIAAAGRSGHVTEAEVDSGTKGATATQGHLPGSPASAGPALVGIATRVLRH